MIALAFIAFALLVVAWVMASNGEVKEEATKTAPASIKMGDARA